MTIVTQTLDSGLIAVALIIRSRDGPRFVFHFPQHPKTDATHYDALYGTELDPEPVETPIEEEDEDDEYDLEEDSKPINHVDLDKDEHYNKANGEHVVPWEHVFDFPTTDLESILTPSKAFHKKKFKLLLDPLHFISYPMHIRDDGQWKKPKKPKKAKRAVAGESSEGLKGESEKNEGEKVDNSSEDGDDHGGMTMFNVVFVLDCPRDQTDERIGEIYEHVIKKFNKALKHAQASSNYVWKESELILTMKEKGKEDRRPMSWLWNEIILKSTLAAAIRDVFEAISNSKIATVQFATTPPLELSLQIPIPSFLMRLPTSAELGMPGLLVTTANPLIDEEGNEDPSYLNKHFTLLLLDDESKIMSEIQADDTDLSAPLIECIRLCKPTLSFLQVAQTNSIEVNSLIILAQHLIFWRRAIAIPPLHGRDTYIVSPNCDSRQLPGASVAWKKAFPLAPTLPGFLAALSAAPRAYKTFAPSKNHRPTYLDMLAWLIRGGWVTRLSHFAWILVWPEIIYEVDYQLKAEAIEKSKKNSKSTSGSSAESAEESSTDKEQGGSPNNTALTTQQVAENARLERLADKVAKLALEEAAAFAKMQVPISTAQVSCNEAEHLKSISPYIIKDPHRVSHEESLYIAAIGKRMKDAKAKECWSRLTKYFNGKEALESIALRENMKRKETWMTLLAYQEHLLICRRW